jgi:hypothetical protein
MNRKIISVLAIALVAGAAQSQSPDMQQKVAALKQSIAENQAALRKYQWIQTTKISLNGEVKQTQVSQCQYQGPGKPVCTELSNTPAEKPSGGPLKRKIIEDKIAEMKAYMDSVKTLVAMYVPPNGEKIEAARNTGNVSFSENPSAGTESIVISNYAQKGDNMAVVLGAVGKGMRELAINTWLNDPTQVVTLRVTMAKLPDGTRYSASKVLNATAKGITVAITSTNYSVVAGM